MQKIANLNIYTQFHFSFQFLTLSLTISPLKSFIHSSKENWDVNAIFKSLILHFDVKESNKWLISVLDDRSSSDEENYNIFLPSPDQEENENKYEAASIFGIDLNVNETNAAELDDNESESDFSDNQSDADEKSLDSFNESDASTNNRNEVSENTTHSYSNSLLEDEDDDANDGDTDEDAIKSSVNLSDLNNGKRHSLPLSLCK